jgi:hypothetical protein
MERFFGRTRDMREIDKTDAESFGKWLIEKEGLAENSTARRTLGYASQIMAIELFSGDEVPRSFAMRIPRHRHSFFAGTRSGPS